VVLFLLTLCGCRSFAPPTPELLKELSTGPAWPGPYLRRQIEIDLDTPALEGHFAGILVARTGSDPAVRLQLFPEVGGKILDLAANSNRISSESTQDKEPFDCKLPVTDPIRPGLSFLFAVSLLEHFSDLDLERVTGFRAWESGYELELAPHPSGVGVRVFVNEDGSIAGREFRYRGRKWREVAGNPLRFEALGLHVNIETVEEDIETDVAAELFQLELTDSEDGSPRP
jgi:hypothetical protein